MKKPALPLLCIAAFLSACGGSDSDTALPPPPPPPQPPPPVDSGCDPARYPALPAGQTYAVEQIVNQPAPGKIGRTSKFVAAGFGIPANQGYGDIHLTPLDARHPGEKMRLQMTHRSGCSHVVMNNLQATLHDDETVASFFRNFMSSDREIAQRYVLEGFSYYSQDNNEPKKVEFHIDPAKYPTATVFDESTLRICRVFFNTFVTSAQCYDTQVRRAGDWVIAQAEVSGDGDLALTSTQPRGITTYATTPPVAGIEPPYRKPEANPAVPKAPNHPQSCGPHYPAIPPGQTFAATQVQNQPLAAGGVGAFSQFALAGTDIPVDKGYGSLRISPVDAYSKVVQFMRLDMAALTDCAWGRLSNVQRTLHAQDTVASFARHKQFTSGQEFLPLYVIEAFAYQGYDPHITKRVTIQVDSHKYPDGVAYSDRLKLCRLRYRAETTEVQCSPARASGHGSLKFMNINAEFTDANAYGTWALHDEEYVLVSTHSRGRDTLAQPSMP